MKMMKNNCFELDSLKTIDNELGTILDHNRSKLKDLLLLEDKTYENFVLPFQLLNENLDVFITPVFHLDSVNNCELTQEAYSKCLPLLSAYHSEISQNEELFNAFKSIDTSSLTIEQKQVIQNEIRDFKLGGCGLEEEKKKRLTELSLRLSELSQKFSQNLLDATNSFEMICDSFEDVKELPQSDRDIASFKEDGVTKWKFTLQMPSYLAYITYGTNRDKREEIYKAYCTRAPENESVIDEILQLKDEKVKLLGFENYAQYSLSTKMASSEDDVISFLEDLAKYGKQKANDELDEVKELALESDSIVDFNSFDMAYYSEKLKQIQYSVDEEEYRPYLEKNSVVNGLFEFLKQTFNIEFKATDIPTWHEKTLAYELLEDGKKIAIIYLDLEARKEKRGGAWMNNWHTRYASKDEVNIPRAFIVCNFPVSNETTPSFLRHSDVVTLFHEMGHALHHLLSNVNEPFVSGINGVAWDVVEFPSQFLEYYSYDKDVLKMFAKHHETGEVLSDEMIDRLIKARNFQSSLALLRQVEFALFDFKLHQKVYNDDEVQNLLDSIRSNIAVLVPPKYNKFQNGFSHIFGGGYAAGYYSYKWAEVLSADAFQLILDNPKQKDQLAMKYRDLILGSGGSKDMNDLYFDFAGRKPEVKSLLKMDGII
jgi:oligopeptidase A